MKTDNISYFGIEKQTDTWEPVGIVGVPIGNTDGYKILRDALPNTLRAVPLDVNLLPSTWTPVIQDKRIIDIVSFLTARKILT
jgi:hypothetical protein